MVTGGPAVADVDTVSGSAFAASATGLVNLPPTPGGAPNGVSGSATEPVDGYDVAETALDIDLAGLVRLPVLRAESHGEGVVGENHDAFSTSEAEVAGPATIGGLTPPPPLPPVPPLVTLDVIRSNCMSSGNGSTGTVDVLVTGLGGAVLLDLNTSDAGVVGPINILGLIELTANERNETNIPGVETSIEVTALRVTLLPSFTGGAALDLILARSVCSAEGPNVLLPTTTTTGGPTTTTTTIVGPTTTTTTTVGPTTTTTGGGGGGNNNNNTNNNTNNNQNSNTNQNSNENNNTIINEITNINVINDENDNENHSGGGGHSHLASGIGGGDPVAVAAGSASRGTLARTGSEPNRVITLAFLALVLGGLLVLGSRGLIADASRSRRGGKRGKREMQ